MSVLDEKIRKNKDLFDVAEPKEGHFNRFKEKLNEMQGRQQPKIKRRSFSSWRIAAVLVVLIGISAALIWMLPGNHSNGVMAAELPEDIREVKQFYDSKAQEKLQQIDQCSENSDDAAMVKGMISQELEELDENSANLEKELQDNKDNQRVRDALILNYKTKSDLLESVIYRLCNI